MPLGCFYDNVVLSPDGALVVLFTFGLEKPFRAGPPQEIRRHDTWSDRLYKQVAAAVCEEESMGSIAGLFTACNAPDAAKYGPNPYVVFVVSRNRLLDFILI
jgi:hypothetical protein